jgi:hypothetical protein
MSNNNNPFPDSEQKAYLRRLHFAYLVNMRNSIGRDLHYFGLPSAEMLDVQLWRSVLGQITAVERESSLILPMYRKAEVIGVRSKLILLETNLVEATRLLALEERVANISIAQLSLPEQKKLLRARSVPYDVINLDMCGGFLYKRDQEERDNLQVLENLITSQSRFKNKFLLVLTFALRDTGREDYDQFIVESLSRLKDLGVNVEEVQDFYMTDKVVGQPPNLRKLRYCVPTYLHKVAHQSFQVRSLGAWYYKTFYHTALLFEPRKSKGALGQPWPPMDEFKELLRAKMIRVDVNDQQQIITKELIAPSLP